MTVYVQDADLTLHCGDALETLRTLPAASMNCCITSPPYLGLRDYGTGTWDGGNPDCDHQAVSGRADRPRGALEGGTATVEASTVYRDVCGRCGARRVDHQLGLEATPDQFVTNLVAVFREVRRVLTDDGTLWLNLGDSYAANYGNGGKGNTGAATSIDKRGVGAKPKDLIGIPWLVARALQEPYYTGRIARERDRVWLAATIDGEGTICGTAHVRKDDGRTRTMPQVFITNSAQAMLDEALRIWPTSQSDHSRPGDGHLGTVDVFRWIVHGIENKTALVQELYPYLIVKRTQALLAYNLLVLMADAKRLGKSSQAQAVRDKREHVCALMSQLNHAQSVDVPSWCVEPPALYEPGWYLRSAITWCKLNAMPESVTDRPTKATEMVFLLAKSARYWYDADAIREPHRHDGRQVTQVVGGNGSIQHRDGERWPGTGANARDWWPIATQSFDGAHFATFPEELVRRCLLAGTPEWVCRVCGKPRERLVATDVNGSRKVCPSDSAGFNARGNQSEASRASSGLHSQYLDKTSQTVGWSDCGHGDNWRPGVVLDQFFGSGTTGLVARKHGRHTVGIELSESYCALAARRLQQLSLLAEGAS